MCKGCRCLELDCWDGDDGEPIIFHGHTLTTKILFRDVINAMAEFNFRVTPYPVVLSIENHCSLPQQELMAEIMKIGFGDSLLMPGELMGSGSHLPTLEQLKYKVLIKGKRLKVGEDLLDDDSGDDSDDDSDDDDDDDDDLAKGKVSKKKKTPALKVHPSLSAIVFLGTCHCTSFAQAASDAIAPDMMTSYGESKTVKYLKNDATHEGWIYHNRTHLRYAPVFSDIPIILDCCNMHHLLFWLYVMFTQSIISVVVSIRKELEWTPAIWIRARHGPQAISWWRLTTRRPVYRCTSTTVNSARTASVDTCSSLSTCIWPPPPRRPL